MKIITARHATTQFSQENRIAGRLDVSLSEAGVLQAKSLRDFVSHISYDLVISSPLSRALKTAQYCTNLQPQEILIHPDVQERNYGKMQGLLPQEIKELRPIVRYVKVGQEYHSLNPPQGESFEQLRQRAEKFKCYLLNHYSKQTILIFSHYAFLQQFHGALLNIDAYNCLEQKVEILEFNFFELDVV